MTAFRLPLWKGAGRRLLFAAIVVLTVLILAASVISFQGRREWDQTKRDLLARGEKLSLAEFAPPPVSDDQNFFADPLWQEVANEKIPAGKRQLEIIHREIPPGEIEALKKRFPRFASVDFKNGPLTYEVRKHLKDADPAARNDAASFVLAALEPSTPILERVMTLLQRPEAQIPNTYTDGFTVALPQLGPMMGLGQAFYFRGEAEIQLGQTANAFRDVGAGFALADMLRNEPFLISILVRQALLGMPLDVIAEGLKAHAWSDAQLATFEQRLAEEDLISKLRLAFRTERGGFNALLESLRRDDPGSSQKRELILKEWLGNETGTSAWFDRLGMKAYFAVVLPGDQAAYNRETQRLIDVLDEVPRRGMKAEWFSSPPEFKSPVFRATHALAVMAAGSVTPTFRRAAIAQDMIIQTRLACALERYYLAHKEYPAQLDQLAPAYLPVIPPDVVTTQPMHYERTASDAFKLWSIGWDGKDDHGRPVARHHDDGDWVWGEIWW